MKRWLILFLTIYSTTSPAININDYGSFDLRSGVGVGSWWSRLEMESPGHKASIDSKPMLGLQAFFGFRLSNLFFEYHLTWLMPGFAARPKPKEASYFSPWGGVVGLAFPPFPFEFFGGVEKGRYVIADGANPVYPNLVYKFGVNYNFGRPERDPISARFEYRRMPAYKDELGNLPPGVITTIHIFFLSLLIHT